VGEGREGGREGGRETQKVTPGKRRARVVAGGEDARGVGGREVRSEVGGEARLYDSCCLLSHVGALERGIERLSLLHELVRQCVGCAARHDI
jgi:hypothetical protein